MNAARNIVIGVDPGLSGAVAFLDTGTKTLISVHDMPLQAHSEGRAIDSYGLSILIDCYARATRLAVVEDVTAMVYTTSAGQVRGQGAASSFKFGKATGILIGVLASNLIPMHFVRPSIWKSILNLSSDKNLSRSLASKLFPSSSDYWKLKKHDGRAEAALLAWFGADRLIKK